MQDTGDVTNATALLFNCIMPLSLILATKLMQAMTWLSIQALGPDGLLNTSELPPTPPSPPTSGLPTTEADHTQRPDEDGVSSDEDGTSSYDQSELLWEPSLAVVCLPGQEDVLGIGVTGPVFVGR